ncbi:MAG: hypothetical protein Q4D02_05100 [Clostridia bacterium]|nr:hypothetical protein [Clostridia bacterium]
MNNYSYENKNKKMIGTSLAFCVRDIIAGKYDIGDVEAIIAGTHFKSADDIIKKYRETYWASDAEKAADICKELWNTGKIIQPCLSDPQALIFVRKVWYFNLESLIDSQVDAGRDYAAANLRQLAFA